MFTCINIAVHEEGELSHQKLLCDYFVSNRCSFVDYVAHNLGEKKKTEIKATLVLEGWVLGDTHFTGSHIGGDTLITRDVRGYTYHCDIGNAIPSIFRNTFLVN